MTRYNRFKNVKNDSTIHDIMEGKHYERQASQLVEHNDGVLSVIDNGDGLRDKSNCNLSEENINNLGKDRRS